ncbi:MAG: M20/M25/M40 family metallo-hydrolase [Candidatus Lokiarchaeota archaeon]|nr:M20/M25/M40 family metallo-hydrolase [Candidatus Lokiarchaeota archaeon]
MIQQQIDEILREIKSCGILESLYSNKKELIENWLTLASIYSPSGGESKRAEYIKKKLLQMGIPHVYIDQVGNVIGILQTKKKGPTTAFLCTMDDLITIADRVNSKKFPVRIENDKIVGPGTLITGSCVTLIALAKLLFAKKTELSGTIYLVAVVQEEQDFGGIRFFLQENDDIDYVIDIMGGFGRIFYGALGIKMLKVHFYGPSGHTLSGGLPNVNVALAEAITQIFEIPLPSRENLNNQNYHNLGIGKIQLTGAYINIGMVKSGKSFNHKPEKGWLSVDLRSYDNEILNKLFEKITHISENIANKYDFKYQIEIYKDLPAAQISDAKNSQLVKFAEYITIKLGKEVFLSDMGSTNMNIGILKGILSIMVAGNEGGNHDTPNEYGNIDSILDGTSFHFLLAYAIHK